MGREEYISRLLAGGGAELYNELLQKELKMNVVAFFTTSLPYWEAFGWMRQPFENLDHLRKLKFRTSGLGLEMMKNMGISVVTLPGAEVLPALERGAIDGAEELVAKHGVQILQTPAEVSKAQVEAMDKVYAVEAQKNAFFARVLNAQREFAKRAVPHAQRIRAPLEVLHQHYWSK